MEEQGPPSNNAADFRRQVLVKPSRRVLLSKLFIPSPTSTTEQGNLSLPRSFGVLVLYFLWSDNYLQRRKHPKMPIWSCLPTPTRHTTSLLRGSLLPALWKPQDSRVRAAVQKSTVTAVYKNGSLNKNSPPPTPGCFWDWAHLIFRMECFPAFLECQRGKMFSVARLGDEGWILIRVNVETSILHQISIWGAYNIVILCLEGSLMQESTVIIWFFLNIC